MKTFFVVVAFVAAVVLAFETAPRQCREHVIVGGVLDLGCLR